MVLALTDGRHRFRTTRRAMEHADPRSVQDPSGPAGPRCHSLPPRDRSRRPHPPDRVSVHRPADRASRTSPSADCGRRRSPTTTFWQWRSLTDPEPVGIRAAMATPFSGQMRLLARVLDAVAPTSVLDVGCGDGRGDPRPADVGLCRDRRLSRSASDEPGRADLHGTVPPGSPRRLPCRADLVICLDVLILSSPTPRPTGIRWLQLWDSTDRALLISGYEQRLPADSGR